MEEFADNRLLSQVLLHNLLDARDGEVAIADGAWPDGQIGTIVTAPLAATGAHVTDVIECSGADGIDEGRAEHFAATKWPMTEIDTKLVCSHGMQYIRRNR